MEHANSSFGYKLEVYTSKFCDAVVVVARQLLWDCGIGDEGGGEGTTGGGGELVSTAAVSQHRVLIFCQYKSMLDILEKDLLK